MARRLTPQQRRELRHDFRMYEAAVSKAAIVAYLRVNNLGDVTDGESREISDELIRCRKSVEKWIKESPWE